MSLSSINPPKKVIELLMNSGADKNEKIEGIAEFYMLIGAFEAVNRECKGLEQKNQKLMAEKQQVENEKVNLEITYQVLSAKIGLRSKFEELESNIIPTWLLDCDIPKKFKWIIALDFELTPHGTMINKRMKESSFPVTPSVFAEAMVEAHHRSPKIIGHVEKCGDINLDDIQWKLLFNDLQMKDEVQQESVKIAMKSAKVKDMKSTVISKFGHNFVCYVNNLPCTDSETLNIRQVIKQRIIEAIIENRNDDIAKQEVRDNSCEYIEDDKFCFLIDSKKKNSTRAICHDQEHNLG